jgi:hypothetical protein
MVYEAIPQGARRVLLSLFACAGAAACTLTDEGYQPSTLVEANESAEADGTMAPALAGAVEDEGCAMGLSGAAPGTAGDGDCSAAIRLLEPAGSADVPVVDGEPAAVESPDAGTPMDEVAAPSECEQGVGEFGEPQRVTGLGLAALLSSPCLTT